MQYELGFSGELASGRWYKKRIKLDEADLQMAAREQAIDYADLGTVAKFSFAKATADRLMALDLRASDVIDLKQFEDVVQGANKTIDALKKQLALGKS